jgi:hypothetical protein
MRELTVLLILALALLAAVAAGGFGGPTWMRRTARST